MLSHRFPFSFSLSLSSVTSSFPRVGIANVFPVIFMYSMVRQLLWWGNKLKKAARGRSCSDYPHQPPSRVLCHAEHWFTQQAPGTVHPLRSIFANKMWENIVFFFFFIFQFLRALSRPVSTLILFACMCGRNMFNQCCIHLPFNGAASRMSSL